MSVSQNIPSQPPRPASPTGSSEDDVEQDAQAPKRRGSPSARPRNSERVQAGLSRLTHAARAPPDLEKDLERLQLAVDKAERDTEQAKRETAQMDMDNEQFRMLLEYTELRKEFDARRSERRPATGELRLRTAQEEYELGQHIKDLQDALRTLKDESDESLAELERLVGLCHKYRINPAEGRVPPARDT